MKKTLLLGLGAVAALSFATPEASAKKVKKPNVIFILADDLGYGDLSCFNEQSKITTPNLDQMASQGVRFTDAHTSSAVCTPTRYGIVTGRYNWRSRLKKGVLGGYSKALIQPGRATVGHFLQDQGYHTACIGKWHLGWDWNNIDAGHKNVDFSKKVTHGPTTHGFDYFFGFCGSLDMAPYVWVENDKPTMVPTKKTVNKSKQAWWREGYTSDDFDHEQVLPDLTKKATAYIDKRANQDKPFFLYFPLPAPHTPILPTAEFKGKSGLNNPYGDFVIMVDWVVGEIMKKLEEKGIADNTLLVFTSDNGCSPQADYNQLATKGHDPSYKFRGHKADIFEGGHHVPYIVRWPKKVKKGVSNQLVCTTDLYATMADILKIKLKDNEAEDSYSILSALKLKSKADKRQNIVHHSINGSFAIRKGDWKVAFCPGSGGWSAPRPGHNKEAFAKLPKVQLYNLKEDIGEENNLQAKHPEIVKEYRELLNEIVYNGRSTKGKKQQNLNMDKWPQLKAIK
ncbi:arylsulfatase [Prolixibacteraceae bacterium JC049]|nr:arylsulfatase [Prolixibacteraceae bacterium JC049]